MSDLKAFDRMFRLDGKVALISGGKLPYVQNHEIFQTSNTSLAGSRGLGLHAATAFLLAGARKVIITARKWDGEQGIGQAVEKLNKLPGIKGEAVGIAANVAQTDDIQRLVDEVKKTERKLDILIANAGATWGGPFESTPDWSSQKVLDLNVRGVFNMIRL